MNKNRCKKTIYYTQIKIIVIIIPTVKEAKRTRNTDLKTIKKKRKI